MPEKPYLCYTSDEEDDDVFYELDDEEVEDIQDINGNPRFQSLDLLRLVLLVFVSFNVFGVGSTDVGSLIQIVSGFASGAFFIISGFLVLQDGKGSDARIWRCISRCAILFAALCVGYFACNAVYDINIFTATPWASKRFWFDFLVLDLWPYDIGGIIWYVEAMLKGYIVLFVMKKLHLLKLDWLFALLFLAFTAVSGEFSSLLGLSLYGFAPLSGNFITRAIPYLLLGHFIRRKLPALSNIAPSMYGLIAAFGIGTLVDRRRFANDDELVLISEDDEPVSLFTDDDS